MAEVIYMSYRIITEHINQFRAYIEDAKNEKKNSETLDKLYKILHYCPVKI